MHPLHRKPPAMEADILATGAWQAGDPVGRWRFARLSPDCGFALEVGGVLPEVTVAYETWGALDADAGNAILLCHALAGDSHVVAALIEGSCWLAGSTPTATSFLTRPWISTTLDGGAAAVVLRWLEWWHRRWWWLTQVIKDEVPGEVDRGGLS